MWAGRAKSMVSLMARGLIVAAAAMTCASAFAQDAPALPKISTVRFGGDASATRLVLDVDAALSAKVVQAQSGPRHIVLSLPRLEAPAGFSGPGQGLVKGWKLESAGGGARLTVDLTADATIKHRFVIPPGGGTAGYRYVIDFAPAPAEVATPVVTPVATIAATEPASVVVAPHLVAATPAPPPAHAGRMVVVIDAGHGGHDPGAQGTLDGAVACEKDITLATALALRARLEKTGRYKVVMTRDYRRLRASRHAGPDRPSRRSRPVHLPARRFGRRRREPARRQRLHPLRPRRDRGSMRCWAATNGSTRPGLPERSGGGPDPAGPHPAQHP